MITDISTTAWAANSWTNLSWSIIGRLAQRHRVAGIMANNRRDRVLAILALENN